MNILIPHSWLGEYLSSKARAKDIQKYLSLSGPSVERLNTVKLASGKKDYVYDIEVSTNRVDMMSIEGIAREATTILNRAGYTARMIKKNWPALKQHPQRNLALPEIIYETEGVRRVMAVVLSDISQQNSPQYIQDRLQAVAINVHDAVVDISNYVTHELGHPCHVFDYDKIMQMGGKIIIKEAKPGKKFITLDEEVHHTVGGEIVFENSAGEIIDLPAVKGTLNTGIDQNTKNILFWIESLDAHKVRYASMAQAIRTTAAQLNEKNVDPYLAEKVLRYAVYLFEKIAKAKVASPVYDYFPDQKSGNKIIVNSQLIKDYLGIDLPKKEITAILRDLDCQVTLTKDKQADKDRQVDQFVILAPTYRADLEIPADIIEEIARIYGYHNLPSQLMAGQLPSEHPQQKFFQVESRIKNFLSHLAWQEIYSYSLVSDKEALMSGYSLASHLKLSNPLKEENVYLRRSILPSLISIMHNNPQNHDWQLFEIARTYQPQKNALPKQDSYLAMLSRRNFRQVKGDLELLLKQFFILEKKVVELVVEEIMTKNHSIYQQSAKLIIKKPQERLVLGHLHLFEDGLAGIEIKLNNLLKVVNFYPHYQKSNQYAQIIEQLTFTLKKPVAVGDFINTLIKSHKDIKDFTLVNVYQDNYTFAIIYQDNNKNLSTEDVEPIRQQVVSLAKKKFQAQLVGKI
ncbi:MAG: phenylalanine--tRNA ligase subunit beta [Candidatus Pacebacteria bacterium]|nr:phenylalanine--tRNA ligase subunit beta [Candidatus Paceibacterota bacterium]